MTKATKSKSTSTKSNATTNNKQKYAIDTPIEKSFPTKYTGKITSYNGRKKAPYGVTYDDDDEVEYMTEKEVAQHKVSRRRGMKRAAKPSTSSNDSEPRPAKKSKGTQTPPPEEEEDDVLDETVELPKRVTRSRGKKDSTKQQQSSNKRNTRSISSGNSDEGSDNNEKGEDEQPPTNKGGDIVADKENDTLDINKDKEEGSPDLVDDSSGDKDDQHDLQFSDDEGGGGGDMQLSPAKSVSSTRSEITTTMSTEITSMLEHSIIQKAMSKLDLRAVHLLGQTMGQVTTDITTPLQNDITNIEDEITNTKQLIEVQSSLQSHAASKKLPTGIELGININDMDTVKEKNTRILEGKENEKAEKLAKLQTINDNRPAIRKLLSNIITSHFTVRSGSYELQPSFDDDNNTDGIESYVIDESTSGIGQIVSELETECEDFVNLLMSVYVKNLEEEKAEYLDELEGNDADRFDYYSLQEKCKKILRSLRTTEGNFEHFRQERLCYEDGPAAYEKEFPGQVKFWTVKANDLDSRWKVAAREHDAVYDQVLAYRAENDIKLQEMLTIKFGNVIIQPPREPPRRSPHESPVGDKEEDGENADTQDALCQGLGRG